jgi:hydrogenase maturation protein HypF
MGVRQVSYEAQAAMELEALALAACGGGVAIEPFPFHLDKGAYPYILSPAGAVAAALAGGLSGSDPGVLAAGFHLGLSRAIVKTCRTIAKSNGVETVALSGGVFQNRLLLEMVMDGLEQKGLYVLSHAQVPPNDGGLSLGQAVLALYQSQT